MSLCPGRLRDHPGHSMPLRDAKGASLSGFALGSALRPPDTQVRSTENGRAGGTGPAVWLLFSSHDALAQFTVATLDRIRGWARRDLPVDHFRDLDVLDLLRRGHATGTRALARRAHRATARPERRVGGPADGRELGRTQGQGRHLLARLRGSGRGRSLRVGRLPRPAVRPSGPGRRAAGTSPVGQRCRGSAEQPARRRPGRRCP